MMTYGERRYRKETNRKGEVRLFAGKREKNLFSVLQSVTKKIMKEIRKSRKRGFPERKKGSGGEPEKVLSTI